MSRLEFVLARERFGQPEMRLENRGITGHRLDGGKKLLPGIGEPILGQQNLAGQQAGRRIEIPGQPGVVQLFDTEPVNVLSRYKFQDGLAYYESTKDTASHFFIDYLPKGVYVFEHSTRVQLKGHYQTGVADMQCMYAPEFNSHSESFGLEVQ